MAAFLPSPSLSPASARHPPKRARLPVCSTTPAPPAAPATVSISRRSALHLFALLAASAHPAITRAAASPMLGEKEVNDVYGYSFNAPPAGWTRNSAQLSSARIATIFLCDDDTDSNINMVVTPVPSDFQKLTSFGSMENVVQTLVPAKGNDISGEVISARSDTRNNSYVVEYTVSAKGIDRHLVTVFSLQPGRYLVTLTGQALEKNWPQRQDTIRAVADSYSLKLLD